MLEQRPSSHGMVGRAAVAAMVARASAPALTDELSLFPLFRTGS